jgi:hypothetical protein
MSWDSWKKGVELYKAHTQFGDRETVKRINRNTLKLLMLSRTGKKLHGLDSIKLVSAVEVEKFGGAEHKKAPQSTIQRSQEKLPITL